jgi:hypothetical protein
MVTDRYQHVRHHDTTDGFVAWAAAEGLPLLGVDKPARRRRPARWRPAPRLRPAVRPGGPGLSDAARAAVTTVLSIPSGARPARSTPASPAASPCTSGPAATPRDGRSGGCDAGPRKGGPESDEPAVCDADPGQGLVHPPRRRAGTPRPGRPRRRPPRRSPAPLPPAHRRPDPRVAHRARSAGGRRAHDRFHLHVELHVEGRHHVGRHTEPPLRSRAIALRRQPCGEAFLATSRSQCRPDWTVARDR